MDTSFLLVLALSGPALLGSASAEVVLPADMYRSNAVYSLYEAAVAGAPKVAAARIQEGAAVNMPDEQGNTPLHLAARANRPRIIRLLLRAGADCLAKDAQGHIPSQLTTADKCREQLLRAEEQRAKELKLAESIRAHHLAAVQQAIRDHINPSAYAENGQDTLLMLALQENQKEIVKALLAAGADPNKVSPRENLNALHVAVKYHRAGIINRLIDAGADPMHMAKNGSMPLHDAAWSGDSSAVRALLPAYASCNFTPDTSHQPLPIRIAVDRGNKAMVEIFLSAGFDPNTPPGGRHSGEEPILHTAAKKGNAEIVLLLLKAGADKSARDSNGKTAAEVAQPNVAAMLR